jgi:hypothetical protein
MYGGNEISLDLSGAIGVEAVKGKRIATFAPKPQLRHNRIPSHIGQE